MKDATTEPRGSGSLTQSRLSLPECGPAPTPYTVAAKKVDLYIINVYIYISFKAVYTVLVAPSKPKTITVYGRTDKRL